MTTIATVNGTQDVALLYQQGVWAVTDPGIGKNGKRLFGLVVTHLPTGCGVAWLGSSERRIAEQLCRLLPQNFMADAPLARGEAPLKVNAGSDDTARAVQWLAIGATGDTGHRHSDAYVLENSASCEGEAS